MTFDQLATVAVALGALSAVVAIRFGNATAMALLASALVSSAWCELVEAGALPYEPLLLVALDLLVIVWIIVGWADRVARKAYGRRRDIAIVALFPAIWPLYFIDRAWTSDAIDLAVAAQMLLCFPVRTMLAQHRERVARLIEDDGGTLELAGLRVWRVARA
jgi:hypothetical protein